MLPWDQPIDPEEAEAWLFPSIPGPQASKPAAAGSGRRKAKRAAKTTKVAGASAAAPAEPAPSGPAPAESVAAEPAEKPTARPPGLRARRSAFAAARSAE
jgi:hypothetical protein